MVFPIVAGGAILGFMAWGKDIFGPKFFKQILNVGIALTIVITGYILYKMYEFQQKVKDDPVGVIFDAAGKAREEVEYISGATLSGLLGGGTSREGYEKVQEVFVHSPQKPFEPGVLHDTPTEKVIKTITDILNLTPKEYILTDCDKLVEARDEFLSPESIEKKKACIEAGYKHTTFKWW